MDKNKKSIIILGANGFIGNALLNDLCNDGMMKVYGMDVENNKLVNSYGVARVRCAGCGHDFFVAFSCRARGVCPSCTSKRSLLFGEKALEIVRPLNHRDVTFTIPKFLRGYLQKTRHTPALYY